MARRYKQRLIMVDDETWEKTKILAEACGKSVSEYIRFLLNLKYAKPKQGEDFWQLYVELTRIGTNINQIAKVANQTGRIEYREFKENYKEVKKIQEELFKKYVKEGDLLDGVLTNTTV